MYSEPKVRGAAFTMIQEPQYLLISLLSCWNYDKRQIIYQTYAVANIIKYPIIIT